MMRTITIEIPMLDLLEAEAVQVMTTKHPNGYCIWVNVNDECVLRIQRIKHLEVDHE